MDLIDVINKVIQDNVNAQKLTELTIGTVTSKSPLKIQINPNMEPLPSEVLLLTEGVTEQEYEIKPTEEFLEKMPTCPEVIGTYKREPLDKDDKVLMLRVMKGQQFIVLSKI